MIVCRNCSHENDDFVTVCEQCKGYLQNRVPNLNLFETAWGIVTSPSATFRQIALAEHKNYTFLIFGLTGIGLAFAVLWFLRLGDRFATLFDVMLWAIPAGLAGGIILAPILALVGYIGARGGNRRASYRNTLALTGYALVPAVLSVLLVLPVELLTFGMFLFTSNPSPAVLKPVSYYTLIAFDGIAVAWTLALMVAGNRVVHGLSLSMALFVTALMVLTLGVALFGITHVLISFL